MSANELCIQQLAVREQAQELYSHHHGWLYGWLLKKIGCSYRAADLSHDAFVKILKKRQVLEIREPRAYLTTIAHGLVVNHWRRLDIEKAYLEALSNIPEEQYPSAESNCAVIEILVQIDAALDSLPDRVRQAFLWSQLDGLSYRIIAEKLSVSERSVKKYMAQAMLQCLLARDQFV